MSRSEGEVERARGKSESGRETERDREPGGAPEEVSLDAGRWLGCDRSLPIRLIEEDGRKVTDYRVGSVRSTSSQNSTGERTQVDRSKNQTRRAPHGEIASLSISNRWDLLRRRDQKLIHPRRTPNKV